MDSEEAAYASAKEKHNKYMVLPGKNQKVRYIEVFQVCFFLAARSFVNKFITISNGIIQKVYQIAFVVGFETLKKLFNSFLFVCAVSFSSFSFPFYIRVFRCLYLGFTLSVRAMT